MEFLLSSQNAHKKAEFEELFDARIIQVGRPRRVLQVEESGKTYHENAYLKAKAYYDDNQVPVFSDDSGLEVEGLPGQLGLYSARFGGEGLSDRERCQLLLEKLAAGQSREASFVAVLCFYLNPQEIFFFEGRLKGRIGHEIRGDGGFGYDPLFIPQGMSPEETLSTLSEWKKKHSHRAQACAYAQKFFTQRVCQNL